MNIFTKNRILVSVLILSIAINVAILGTLGFQRSRHRIAEPVDMQARPNHARFIANELNLTKDQEVQFKELRQQYSRQSQESREALGDHYKQIMIELGSPEPNEQLLDSLAKQVGILHIDQQRATINHFLSLRKICSFDQYEKLQELFIRMRNREQMGRREGSPRNQRQKSKE